MLEEKNTPPPPTPAHVGEKDTTEVLRVEKNESNLMCP